MGSDDISIKVHSPFPESKIIVAEITMYLHGSCCYLLLVGSQRKIKELNSDAKKAKGNANKESSARGVEIKVSKFADCYS